MDDPTRRIAEQDGIDEQELRRHYYQRLSDWADPQAVRIYRNRRMLEPLSVLDRVELRKRTFKSPWARVKR